MKYNELPVYRDAVKMCVYVENIVRYFDKYNKYAIGLDLRNTSKSIVFNIGKINFIKSDEEKLLLIKRLRDTSENMKILIQIANELKAFKSFDQFKNLSEMAVIISRQAQGWFNKYAGVSKL